MEGHRVARLWRHPQSCGHGADHFPNNAFIENLKRPATLERVIGESLVEFRQVCSSRTVRRIDERAPALVAGLKVVEKQVLALGRLDRLYDSDIIEIYKRIRIPARSQQFDGCGLPGWSKVEFYPLEIGAPVFMVLIGTKNIRIGNCGFGFGAVGTGNAQSRNPPAMRPNPDRCRVALPGNETGHFLRKPRVRTVAASHLEQGIPERVVLRKNMVVA